MPEPQIVIVVNSLTEAHKLERELVMKKNTTSPIKKSASSAG